MDVGSSRTTPRGRLARWRASLLVCVLLVTLFVTAAEAMASEYAWDANTLVLEHFNGSHTGIALWGSPDYLPSTGPLGQAARLDYTQDLIAYNPAGLQTLQNAGTVEMWVYLDDYPVNGGFDLCALQWYFTSWAPGSGWVGHLSVNGAANPATPLGTYTYSVWGAFDSPISALSDGVVPLHRWTHLAVTWGYATGTTIYRDGVPVAHTPFNVWPASPNVAYLGWWPQSSPFAPVLDEVRISNVARPGSEIAAHVAGNTNGSPTVVLAAPDVTCCEGGEAVQSFTCVDPDGDALTVQASDGTVVDLGGGEYRWTKTEAEGPSTEAVTITADDGRGGTASAVFGVTVENVAPDCLAMVGPAAPIGIGTPVTITVPFTDDGVQDTHIVSIDWGDGAVSAGVVDESSGAGHADATHAYTSPDVYTVTATVSDDDGAAAQASYRYVVAYDPAGGFVTGGGSIHSPEGAYVADTSMSGKATFGFVSKYLKGANTPTGNTEFCFHAAGMRFASTSYEWLVIGGARAQYKGAGNLNGAPGYNFMLTAIDGQVSGGGGVDRIRVKIWERETGMVVYDSQMAQADEAAPSSPLTGGSIVIHKAK